MSNSGTIRIGIGGWVYPPWRGTFYPPGLPQSQELAHASRHLTAIEINGTFYNSGRPESFRKWRDATPEGFVFSLKGPRFVTHRTELAAAGGALDLFFSRGVLELGDKLGPILWQFAPTKPFDAADFAAFLDLLPKTAGNRKIRHVIEARHRSFAEPGFAAEKGGTSGADSIDGGCANAGVAARRAMNVRFFISCESPRVSARRAARTRIAYPRAGAMRSSW